MSKNATEFVIDAVQVVVNKISIELVGSVESCLL